MAKARQKRPAYKPYVAPDLPTDPWMPFYPAHAKALENRRTLNSSHKRHSSLGLSFQMWTFYNFRFLLAGDLAGDWAPFGGISAQLTHLGLLISMAVVENATIAMTYAKFFREQSAHLARLRTTTIDWAHFLSEEDGVINLNVLRELGQLQTARQIPTKTDHPANKWQQFPPQSGQRGRQGQEMERRQEMQQTSPKLVGREGQVSFLLEPTSMAEQQQPDGQEHRGRDQHESSTRCDRYPGPTG